jgi:glycine/D-amino acid oxidase-like deaminating enzyme
MPRYPRARRGTLRADVAVIGGGLTGLSAAYHLLGRRPGARVLVLEARRVGAGASGRTTGLLGPGVGQSLGALVRRHGPARARALYVATLGAVEDVRGLVTSERIDCELSMTGHLVIARSPVQRRHLAEQAILMRELELPYQALDDDALDRSIHLRRVSGQGTRTPAALRLPVAGTLHPGRLLAGLADGVIARGGAIFEDTRVSALDTGRPVRIEIDGGGEVCADEVVLATAAYTPDLGLLRGRILPVHVQAVVTEPLEPRSRAALGWSGREGIIEARRIFNYFRLTTDERIVFGGGRPRYLWGGRTDDGPRAGIARDLLGGELRATFGPEIPLRVSRSWTGVIGYVLDTLPAIGRVRGRPSLVQAVGWCGHGLALSVASGGWVAQILCDGAAPEDLPWYRDEPPRLVFEVARWGAFQAGVRIMALLDRIA